MKLSPTNAIIASSLVLAGCLATGYFAGSFSDASVLYASEPAPSASARLGADDQARLRAPAALEPGSALASVLGTIPAVVPEAPGQRMTVRAPNSSIGAPLRLVFLAPPGQEPVIPAGWAKKPASYLAIVDIDHVAHFEGLVPGEYNLFGNYRQDSMAVQIPCDTVVFEEKVANSLRVLGIEPGSPADHAGLVDGDVVIAVDGSSLRTAEGVRNFTRLATAEAASMTVVRDAEQLEVALVGGPAVRLSHGIRVEPCASTQAPSGGPGSDPILE